jgi:hypothetical protein
MVWLPVIVPCRYSHRKILWRSFPGSYINILQISALCMYSDANTVLCDVNRFTLGQHSVYLDADRTIHIDWLSTMSKYLSLL